MLVKRFFSYLWFHLVLLSPSPLFLSCSSFLSPCSREDLKLTVNLRLEDPDAWAFPAPDAHLLLLELLAILKLAQFSLDLYADLPLILESILLPVNHSALLFPMDFQAFGRKGEICLYMSSRAQLKHGAAQDPLGRKIYLFFGIFWSSLYISHVAMTFFSS